VGISAVIRERRFSLGKAQKTKKRPRALALASVADPRLRQSIQRQLPPDFSGTVIYNPDKVEYVKAPNAREAQGQARRRWGTGRKRLLKLKF
jgi:hypothetical protein